MFRCIECQQVDNFSLMLSSDYKGPGVFSQTFNEHGEIIINIDGFEFIPDLAFMNSHAVCKFCGTINNFEYYFEKESKLNVECPITDNKPDINVDVNPKTKKRGKKQ